MRLQYGARHATEVSFPGHVPDELRRGRPSNKVAGSRGRESFQAKRREVLDSSAHWIEVDLLRDGVPVLPRKLLPPCHYLVHVSPAGSRPRGLVWPIRIADRLPVITIPLAAGESDVSLDLQSVLSSAYDREAWDLRIDYRADPVPVLQGEDAAWAGALLAGKNPR